MLIVNIELKFQAYLVSVAPRIIVSSTNGFAINVIVTAEQEGSTSFKSNVMKFVLDPTVAVILNL